MPLLQIVCHLTFGWFESKSAALQSCLIFQLLEPQRLVADVSMVGPAGFAGNTAAEERGFQTSFMDALAGRTGKQGWRQLVDLQVILPPGRRI